MKIRIPGVLCLLTGPLLSPFTAVAQPFAASSTAPTSAIEVWHGDRQRVGHLGDAQDDFNILGHIERWRELDTLYWSLRGAMPAPASFRAFRRLVNDGDFNIDLPIGLLRPGENTIRLSARFRDGTTATREVVVTREDGRSPLPFRIDWGAVSDPQEVGQFVDGRWRLTQNGLRTAQAGYDRIFLIGERSWRDYDVRTTLTLHRAEGRRPGLGLIWRFAGHIVGGPRNFPSAQPKWGYEPFGGIGWIRWWDGEERPPIMQFHVGSSTGAHAAPGHLLNFGTENFAVETPYAVRLRCQTLPDAPEGEGVTRYQFKIWPAGGTEPDTWSWEYVQTSRHALRTGGLALLAHQVDATFGNIEVQPMPMTPSVQARSENTIRIALAQFDAVPEQNARNVAAIARLARQAASQGAEVVMFHESAVTDYVSDVEKYSEEVPGGPACQAIGALARELGIHISFGLSEKTADKRYYITQVFMGPAGLVHRYRKTWIVRGAKTGDGQFEDIGYRNEHVRYDPGTGPEPFEIAGLRATSFICADAGSPRCIERARQLRPQIVFFPNNRASYLGDRAHFRKIAAEIGAPLLVANRVGKSWMHETKGGCAVISGTGEILANTPRDVGESVLVFDLPSGRGS